MHLFRKYIVQGTAFTSHRGLYRFIWKPLEWQNALDPFQRTMDVVLSSIKWQIVLVYLGCIIVFSKLRKLPVIMYEGVNSTQKRKREHRN